MCLLFISKQHKPCIEIFHASPFEFAVQVHAWVTKPELEYLEAVCLSSAVLILRKLLFYLYQTVPWNKNNSH